jgi:hypothetical protein
LIPEAKLPREGPIFAFSHISQDEVTSATENIPSSSQDSYTFEQHDWQELNPMGQRHSQSTHFLDSNEKYPGLKMLQPIALPSSDSDCFPPPSDIDILPLPFSTPGPSSTVSADLFHGSPLLTVNEDPINPAEQDMNEIWPSISMTESLNYPSINRSVLAAPIATRPHPSILVLAQPELVYIPASPSSQLFYEDLPIDCSNSDSPPPDINAHKLPPADHLRHIKEPFSTPGLRFHMPLPQPTYFDSPTEDPADSDPLSPPNGYELDGLDFRWEPFTRKNESGRTNEEVRRGEWDSPMDFNMQDSADDRTMMGFRVRRDTPDQTTNENQMTVVNLDCNVFPPVETRNSCSPLCEGFNQGAKPVVIEQKKFDTAFAPTPGIFISPLRQEPDSTKPQETDVDMPHELKHSQVCAILFHVSDTNHIFFLFRQLYQSHPRTNRSHHRDSQNQPERHAENPRSHLAGS